MLAFGSVYVFYIYMRIYQYKGLHIVTIVSRVWEIDAAVAAPDTIMKGGSHQLRYVITHNAAAGLLSQCFLKAQTALYYYTFVFQQLLKINELDL